MSLNSINQFAATIANTSNEQSDIKQNMSGDDSTGVLQVQFSESVVADGTDGLTVIKHTYEEDSFIIDHPTLGDLDSSVLMIDGGYAATETAFPLTYPITLGEGELIFNIDI